VAARRVLLDALEALGTLRKAVLVGAQAIYLHVGEGDLAVRTFRFHYPRSEAARGAAAGGIVSISGSVRARFATVRNQRAKVAA
jgi:hypothetical protein